jgi:hypothetical protein
MRAGNQINFGLAYYNSANMSRAFTNTTGYVMPLTSNPTLMGANTYVNSDLMKNLDV